MGKTVHVTDEVDISLVKPRARKYEQAGAASAAAKGDEKKEEKTAAT
jgi:succinate dehydrogenase / fumarate reductase flavoprotein subunit